MGEDLPFIVPIFDKLKEKVKQGKNSFQFMLVETIDIL